MHRYQGSCARCRERTHWVPDANACRSTIEYHVDSWHRETPDEGLNYTVADQRGCDYCESAWQGRCATCGHDFCAEHRGTNATACVNCAGPA
jgi:hypothetical protein